MRTLLLSLLIACFTVPACDAYTLVLPQMANGPHWNTTLRLSNRSSDAEIEIKGRLFKSDGTPWTSLGFSYMFGGTYEADQTGAINFSLVGRQTEDWTTFRRTGFPGVDLDLTGWLALEIDDIHRDWLVISAFMTYYPDGLERPAKAQVGIFPTPLCTRTYFTIDAESAVAITNTSYDPVTVGVFLTLQGFGEDRTWGPKEVELGKFEQKALFIRELFPTAQDPLGVFIGRVCIATANGSRTFASLPLIFRQSGVMTSVPALALNDTW